jgi:HAD superfamily hydrolase (TIGR01509 family)
MPRRFLALSPRHAFCFDEKRRGSDARGERETVSQLRAVLLDLDGTLVDSNDAHARAWVEALRHAGHAVTFAQVRPLIGMGGDKLLPEVTGLSADSESGQRITKHRKRLFLERYLPALKPFPDAARLAARMHDQGLRLVVATSANEEEMRALVRVAQIEPYLHHATSASEAESSKPDPDIVEAALAKAGVPPEEAILLGDTEYDVTAGERAGVLVVALRSGGSDDAELAGAIAIYDDARALLESYDASPFAPGARDRSRTQAPSAGAASRRDAPSPARFAAGELRGSAEK